jgi:thymidylate synthase
MALMGYQSADEAFVSLTRQCIETGISSAPRGMGTLEMTSQAFSIEDPRDRIIKARAIRAGYSAASVAWNLAERDDVSSICTWNENGRKISDDGDTFYGANYGVRMMPYLEEAMYLLKKDPSTRRAFVPIWTPEDMMNPNAHDSSSAMYSRSGKDVPCTIGFGLRILEGKLVMQVVMRSQALFGVMPYDIFLFTVLQELIANEMKLPLGWYEHHMMSAHIYEREMDAAKEAAHRKPWKGSPQDPIPYTLNEARNEYPRAFDLAMKDELKIDNSRRLEDPLIKMMRTDAPLKQAA